MFSSSVRFKGAKPDSIFQDCVAGLDFVSVLLEIVSVLLSLAVFSLGLSSVCWCVSVSLRLSSVSLGLVSVSLNLVCISFLVMVLLKTGYRVVVLMSGEVVASAARVETVKMKSRFHKVNCKVEKVYV